MTGYNLRTLAVGIKALYHTERSSALSGRSSAWASRKKIGVSGREVKRLPDVSDSLIA